MTLSDVELELFELAYALRQPLQTILDMPYDEYLGWGEYFKRSPIGWREDYRAAMIMKASGTDIKPEQIFPSLKPPVKTTDVKNIRNSAVFGMMKRAVGGDVLSYEEEPDA